MVEKRESVKRYKGIEPEISTAGILQVWSLDQQIVFGLCELEIGVRA